MFLNIFSPERLNWFDGQVYENIVPLVAEDIADQIIYVTTRPRWTFGFAFVSKAVQSWKFLATLRHVQIADIISYATNQAAPGGLRHVMRLLISLMSLKICYFELNTTLLKLNKTSSLASQAAQQSSELPGPCQICHWETRCHVDPWDVMWIHGMWCGSMGCDGSFFRNGGWHRPALCQVSLWEPQALHWVDCDLGDCGHRMICDDMVDIYEDHINNWSPFFPYEDVK